jgi:hypothetical protein
MDKFIIGLILEFLLCLFMMNSYHTRIAKRGYLIIDDYLYEVKLKDKKED